MSEPCKEIEIIIENNFKTKKVGKITFIGNLGSLIIKGHAAVRVSRIIRKEDEKSQNLLELIKNAISPIL